ncbi:VTT domain-containing protein [Methanoregula sp.]|jgi:membrane-associated protein|uniref:VTT domain-containing protein n=1 Tax=Methanoregula sp. TaxID=2052170 RepID=UPI003C1F43C4
MVLPFILDIILNFDKYLPQILNEYGTWTYLILFLILFCETGLVITPYLPGDSLLFVASALAGAGYLNIWVLLGVLILAAVLGDTVNYWIGFIFEMRVLEWRFSPVRKEHLDETHQYFTKYGGFTIVIARFIPFIRTFAPFLAGVGEMPYPRFLSYNVLGGLAWVTLFLSVGYLFGNLPVVKENFSLVVYAIIGISLIACAGVIVKSFRPGRTKEKSG